MSVVNFKHVRISGITSVVPPKIIYFQDEACYYDNDINKVKRLQNILGINKRYVVEDNVTSLDLCEKAALYLIDKLGIDINKIECIIVSSTSHDYAVPASACILQGRLNLPESCTAMDFSGLGCSAYVHGIMTASSLIESGAFKNCLFLAGNIPSTSTDVRNRISNMLFCDCSAATFLEYSSEEIPSCFVTGTRGKSWDKIVAPATGKRLPIRKDIADLELVDNNGNVWHLWDDLMQGMDVFKFSLDVAPKSIEQILHETNTTIEDIDFFAIHQANKQIVHNIIKLLKIPADKFSYDTFYNYGNCGMTSVASVVCDQLVGKNFSKVLLCSFGVGLSWASCLLDLSKTYNGGIQVINDFENVKTRQEMIEYWTNAFLNKESI